MAQPGTGSADLHCGSISRAGKEMQGVSPSGDLKLGFFIVCPGAGRRCKERHASSPSGGRWTWCWTQPIAIPSTPSLPSSRCQTPCERQLLLEHNIPCYFGPASAQPAPVLSIEGVVLVEHDMPFRFWPASAQPASVHST